jgi:hypothetical protein
MGKIYSLLVVGALLVLGVIGVSTYIGLSNQEVQLRQQVVAQQQNNQVVFDTTWKIIQQDAQVADQYKDAFAKIYPDLMNARYGKGDGTLMKWIQESNPNFDTSLYNKVATAIEAQRTNFANEQKKLIDLKREHDTLCMTFPGSIFLGSKQDIKIDVVTSTTTEQAFATHKEDNVKVFGN